MKQVSRNLVLLTLLLTAVLLAGCQQHTIRPQLKSEFDRKVDQLVLDTVESMNGRIQEVAPAAVISGNVMNEKPFTRLDELLVQRLKERLAQDREVIDLSRENWFEFREKRPISFKGHDRSREPILENMLIFMVHVDPEPLFDRIKVSISARNAKTLPIPGVGGKTVLEYFDDSPGTLLLKTPVDEKPIPEGLKQRPFQSMEQMAYSMASELSYAIERGIKAGRQNAADEEIRIVVGTANQPRRNDTFQKAFSHELSQSLAAMDKMTCSVSKEDFSPVFRQINFYQNNEAFFEIEKEKLAPGTVLLLVETKKQSGMDQAALRAIWRVTPLMDKNNELVTGTAAGTYVAGFTSRAWFAGNVPQISNPPEIVPQRKKDMPDQGFD